MGKQTYGPQNGAGRTERADRSGRPDRGQGRGRHSTWSEDSSAGNDRSNDRYTDRYDGRETGRSSGRVGSRAGTAWGSDRGRGGRFGGTAGRGGRFPDREEREDRGDRGGRFKDHEAHNGRGDRSGDSQGREGRFADRGGRPHTHFQDRSQERPDRLQGRSQGRQGGRSADAGAGFRDVCARMESVHELFPRTAVTEENFALLHAALNAVLPLKKSHRQELARNVVQLSRLLTVNRADLRSPYWAKPALTSAYVHYFLPWNIYRLSRLLAGLTLPEPGDGHFVLDVGSGPLTMPIALWLSQPAWRTKKLHLVAADCAGHPLHLGRDILVHLAEAAGCEPWDIHLVQAPFMQALRSCQPMFRKGLKPIFVTAANVLNELPFPKRSRFDEDEGGSEEGDELYSRFEDVLAATARLLRRGPEEARALFVEPGTRLGGLTLMRLRGLALEQGLEVHGPCTHTGPCPLMQEMEFAGETSRLAGRTWCHATFPPVQAPDWLSELTAEAGFARETLSLSWLEVSAEAGAGMPFLFDSLDDDLDDDLDDGLGDELDGDFCAGDEPGDEADAACSEAAAAEAGAAEDSQTGSQDNDQEDDQEDGLGGPAEASVASADRAGSDDAPGDRDGEGNTDSEGDEDSESGTAAGRAVPFAAARAEGPARTGIRARVISNVFAVPGLGSCRYACSSLGLLLLAGADSLPDGADMVLHVEDIASARVDKRSGARILVLPATPGQKKDARGQGAGRVSGRGFGRTGRPADRYGERAGDWHGRSDTRCRSDRPGRWAEEEQAGRPAGRHDGRYDDRHDGRGAGRHDDRSEGRSGDRGRAWDKAWNGRSNDRSPDRPYDRQNSRHDGRQNSRPHGRQDNRAEGRPDRGSRGGDGRRSGRAGRGGRGDR